MTETDATPSGESLETLGSSGEAPDAVNAMTVSTRHGNGRYRRDPEVARRDARCADLYREGLTFREIADALDIDVAQAHRGVTRVLKAYVGGSAEALREAMDEQLDELEAQLWEIVEKDRYIVSAGRVTDQEDETPRLNALAQLRAVNESKRKLHGVDSATKVQVDGGVRYEVVGVDPGQLT